MCARANRCGLLQTSLQNHSPLSLVAYSTSCNQVKCGVFCGGGEGTRTPNVHTPPPPPISTVSQTPHGHTHDRPATMTPPPPPLPQPHHHQIFSFFQPFSKNTTPNPTVIIPAPKNDHKFPENPWSGYAVRKQNKTTQKKPTHKNTLCTQIFTQTRAEERQDSGVFPSLFAGRRR